MITSTIYNQENFLKIRYDLFYLSDLKRTGRIFDGNEKKIKSVVISPSIEIFWMRNSDNLFQMGTSLLVFDYQKISLNILESKELDYKLLEMSLESTLCKDIDKNFKEGVIEKSINDIWPGEKKINYDFDNIYSRVSKRVDVLSRYFDYELNNIWNLSVEEYRLQKVVPINTDEALILKNLKAKKF